MSTPTSSPVAPHPVLTEYYPTAEARRERVNAMFDASARHYDWINALMSFGSGRWYRSEALKRHGLVAGTRLIDVGAGTGVISLIAQPVVGDTGEVLAVDPSEGMLGVARANGVLHTLIGRAEALPAASDHFDLLTMGYALRHVADLSVAFAEYRRVLKPGGKVLLLEITPPEGRGLSFWLMRGYMRWAVPLITRLFRGSAAAEELMRYYWDTIEHCVPPATILTALEQAGFRQVKRQVVIGVMSEYTGVK